MFSWFKKKKSNSKQESTNKNISRPSIASDPFKDTKRWSSTVKLQPNVVNKSSLNIRPVINEEEEEEVGEHYNNEKGLITPSDVKLDLLRGTKEGKRESSTFTGIAGGRNVQRKVQVPDIGFIGPIDDAIGSNNPRILGSRSSMSLSGRGGGKPGKKLQKRDSNIPTQTLPTSSTNYSLAPGQMPSRISNYWHDYPSISPESVSNPTVPTLAPPIPQSNELASRLSELAISYSDGLVDEEEYRLLRTEVFVRFTRGEVGVETMGALSEGSEQVPKLDEALFVPRAFGSSAINTSDLIPPSKDLLHRASSSQSIGSRTKSSIINGSLFSKTSKSDLEEDWDVVHPKGLAITDILNHQAENNQILANSYSSNTLALPSSSAASVGFQPRSLRNYPGIPIRGDVRLVPGSSSAPKKSSIKSSRSSSSVPSRTKLHTDTFTAPNPAVTISVPISLDPFSFASTDAEPTSLELKLEISQLESELGRLQESWEGLERTEITKWEDKLGPIGLDHFVNHSAKPPSELSSVDTDDKSLTLSEPNLQRTVVLNSKDTRLSNLDLTTSSLPSVSNRQAYHSIPSNSPSSLAEEVDLASEQLLIVVEGIRSRKRKTEQKYEERLEYLRARLSGALLKERIQDR